MNLDYLHDQDIPTTELTPGKRYRYTVEGTLNDLGNLDLGESYVLPRPLLGHRGTVELLPDPLPTTPGSVVRDWGGTLLMRILADDGRNWIDGTGEVYPDSEIPDAIVLFDAGAQR